MQINKEQIKRDFEAIFGALNSISWLTKTACSCIDDYGIPDPNCSFCGGSGYTETTKAIQADVETLKGDERIAVDAGILNAGDLVVRTSIDNEIKVGDKLTYNSQSYEVRYVTIDQLKIYYEIGAHKIA